MAAKAATPLSLRAQQRPHQCIVAGISEPERRDPLALSRDLPLCGRRVMITAPRQYAHKLSGRLMEAGAQPVWLPAIAITALTEPAALAHLDAA
eukprot:CAMPEP_0177753046 /NCGR_PEP_ID=MMETSP0491_2-20121128/1243_1 /TAXON_ID=63592 /ORGANISM="Tetraselmis chuii, Strain PLY429" /LENGTH=93 /DNA_ID=CAMNT_0019268289 /DNA_START=174 /DNA_END=452 /DNA_ORIENTATION=-